MLLDPRLDPSLEIACPMQVEFSLSLSLSHRPTTEENALYFHLRFIVLMWDYVYLAWEVWEVKMENGKKLDPTIGGKVNTTARF